MNLPPYADIYGEEWLSPCPEEETRQEEWLAHLSHRSSGDACTSDFPIASASL